MCGPTVYDSAHIGHASSYVRFDIIRRIMGSVFDVDTMLVMGITDIDDKIIRRVKEVRSYFLFFCSFVCLVLLENQVFTQKKKFLYIVHVYRNHVSTLENSIYATFFLMQ